MIKTPEEYLALDARYIWHPCSQMKDYETMPPILLERGDGCALYDTEGKKYLDIISSWWCNLLGHSHPRLNKAIQDQSKTLEHVIFANFTHKPAIDLCAGLVEILPKGLSKFFFSDNGSAAIEVAMKMSFQFFQQTGKPKKIRFMALEDAYHGETLAALSVGGVSLYSQLYQPLLLDVIHVPAPDCYRCPYGLKRASCEAECFDAALPLIQNHAHEVCGFLVEPLLQGAAGMKMYSPVFLKKLREATRAHDIHLIADEIATGFGRTGTMFACDQAGITPDFICLSKGLTGGYMPMSITVTTESVYAAFYADYAEGKAFMHSHTYSGNPMGCRLGLEVLAILEEERILEQATEKAVYFSQKLNERFADHPHIGEIRGLGLIHALEIVKNKETKEGFPSVQRTGYALYQEAMKQGLILRPLGDILYFNPPLTITCAELDEAMDILEKVLNQVLPVCPVLK